MENIIKQDILLNKKYDIVITNPPYLGSKRMNKNLKSFLDENFKDSKSDLFSTFIERCIDMTKNNFFTSIVTMQSWMFLKTYENLRKKIFSKNYISTLLHMSNGVMGIAFGTSATIFRKSYLEDFKGIYTKIDYVDINSKTNTPYNFPVPTKYYDSISLKSFKNISGNPVAYWVDNNIIDIFQNETTLKNLSKTTGSQNKTANNNKYLRYCWEVNINSIDPNKKWVYYAKGGNFRKYYGNIELVVDWSDEAKDFYKTNKTSNLLNEEYWYKEGITYTMVSSKGTSFRYLPPNCIFDMGGPSISYLGDNIYYVLGLLNSEIIMKCLKILNPTLNIQNKDILALPIIVNNNYKDSVDILVKDNIIISKNDWNSNETSLMFVKHELLNSNKNSIEISFQEYMSRKNKDIERFNENEVKLNKIFNKIYNTDFEYDIEFNKFLKMPEKEETIKSFISYFVGCLFGRYSLDEEGLISAGKFNISQYHKFMPDEDNIVPILDDEYFDDDIVSRFVEFVKICFGDENLEENLDFIADALNKSGTTSREKIRKYFLTDFFKNHGKMYKKRPIYWQFDSGKQNGFKCLIYMHRYKPDTLARIRTEYLHKTQKAYETEIENNKNIKNNTMNKKDKTRADKQIKKLTKQLEETKKYDEKLAELAEQNININLDDGVKINHEKFKPLLKKIN